MADQDQTDDVFKESPEQIEYRRVSIELTEMRIKAQAQTEELKYLKGNIEAANRTIGNLTDRANREKIENDVRDEMIDKLLDRISKS